jgi:enoyl-CoA hydratase
MSQGEVRIETLDADLGVVRVTIDRAPVNAMGLHLYQELTDVFRRLRFEDGTKCAILTGAGDRAFVAGSDIGEFAKLSPENAPQRSAIVRGAFSAIRNCAVPVVGAINGAALGGGIALAASCDMLVASEHATFGLPEIGVGVLGGTKHLSRLVPPMLMRRMAMTGHRIGAEELARYGAIAAVVPLASLQDEALKLARDVARHHVPALRLQKEVMNLIEALGVQDGYQVEQLATGLLSGTPESKLAVSKSLKPPK